MNAYVAPRSDREKAVAAVWSSVLGISKIGLKDNFFELGGHSLKIVVLMNKITKRRIKS